MRPTALYKALWNGKPGEYNGAVCLSQNLNFEGQMIRISHPGAGGETEAERAKTWWGSLLTAAVPRFRQIKENNPSHPWFTVRKGELKNTDFLVHSFSDPSRLSYWKFSLKHNLYVMRFGNIHKIKNIRVAREFRDHPLQWFSYSIRHGTIHISSTSNMYSKLEHWCSSWTQDEAQSFDLSPLGTYSAFRTYFAKQGSSETAHFTFRDWNHKQIKWFSHVTHKLVVKLQQGLKSLYSQFRTLSTSTRCAPLLNYSGLPLWELIYYEEANLWSSAHALPGLSVFAVRWSHNCLALIKVFAYTGSVVGNLRVWEIYFWFKCLKRL